MPIAPIKCPDCGLLLRLSREGVGSQFLFDAVEWQARCKLTELGAPVWCLIRRDGTSALTPKVRGCSCPDTK